MHNKEKMITKNKKKINLKSLPILEKIYFDKKTKFIWHFCRIQGGPKKNL